MNVYERNWNKMIVNERKVAYYLIKENLNRSSKQLCKGLNTYR